MAEDVSTPEGFVREIGATTVEFERGLRLAVPACVSVPSPGCLQVVRDGTVLQIDITALPERRLGLFCLPVLQARYRFVAGDVPARIALLTHIDRAMQRGGG